MRQNVYGMAYEGRIYNPKGEKTKSVWFDLFETS